MVRLPQAQVFLEERELCRRFAPVRFPIRETLLNLAVATLMDVPVVTTGWLAQKSLTRGLTFGAIK
jgi:ABC-type glycerol-3-phosphate transport system permease component